MASSVTRDWSSAVPGHAEHVGLDVGLAQVSASLARPRNFTRVLQPELRHLGLKGGRHFAAAHDLQVHVEFSRGLRDRIDQDVDVLFLSEAAGKKHRGVRVPRDGLAVPKLVGSGIDAIGQRQDLAQERVLVHRLGGERGGGGDDVGLAHHLAHVLPGDAPHDVLEPLRKRQERVQVFRHEVVGGHDPDAAPLGFVEHVLTDHVVALDVHYVRLDAVEQEADFLLDFPGEGDPEVLVRGHCSGSGAGALCAPSRNSVKLLPLSGRQASTWTS